MMTDDSYTLATCPRCHEMWLESVTYYPATRWEPEDVSVAELPCPKCGNEEGIYYPHDTQYGGFAVAALECAWVIGETIAWWGLSRCTRCGHPAWEGGTMCPPCVQKAADEYFTGKERPQRCPNCGNEELQLSHNTLSFYCQPCDQWFDEAEEARRQ